MSRRTRRRAVPVEDLHHLLALPTIRTGGLTAEDLERIPAGPTRAHVRRLQAAGWGTRTIALRAGLSRHTLKNLLNGHASGAQPTRMVRRDTARRLLGIEPGESKPLVERP